MLLHTATFLAAFAFLVNFITALNNNDIHQLKEVIEKLDEDYQQGNMSRLSSHFKSALKKYGNGRNRKHSTYVQGFLKKMQQNGEVETMKKLETEWNDYKNALGKHYNQTENSIRMTIFETNEMITEEINKQYEEGLITYKTGLNKLADLTDDEFAKRNGLQLPNISNFFGTRMSNNIWNTFYKYNKSERLPRSVDWRKRGYVTPIKDQGECGSCYAFATAAALETYYKKRTGNLEDLSPQNIVDCTWGNGNSGCRGGFMTKSFEYTMRYGVAKESNYPYVESVQRCKWNQGIAVVKNKGYAMIQPGDELALKHAIARRGPVTVGIPGYEPSFRFYKSGLYGKPYCGNPNHAVLVVGYGTHRVHGDYWIIKNSWGTDWGVNGYGYMARNRGNMCDIASYAVLPI